jgi:FkbM family methyltransferase
VLFYTFFHRFHLPPKPISNRTIKLILDFGSNIGCTIAHFACLYPEATVIGVELDPENADLCRRNISPWAERCQIVEGGVWKNDGHIEYVKAKGAEDGYSVTAMTQLNRGPIKTAKAISVNSLLQTWCSGRDVDYIKMDIEGAEREVLRSNTEWAAKVKSMKVEIHGDYSAQDCVNDLERLGFAASLTNDNSYSVVAVRHVEASGSYPPASTSASK